MKYVAIISALLTSFLASGVQAWDGYDYETGNYIEIESGNLVREGREIEYYDYESGEYKYGDVESIDSYGGTTEIEVYDHDSGEYRTFDME